MPTDSMRREADNEDNKRDQGDQRKNENSLISRENVVIQKTYRRVRFREGFKGCI